MDEVSAIKQKDSCEANSKIFIITEMNGTEIQQKIVKKSKKDCLKEKKRLKNFRVDQKNRPENNEINSTFLKNKDDEDNSLVTQDPGTKKIKSLTGMAFQKPINFLEGILNKPPYVTVHQQNTIIGDFGHASAIFKRPFIEGSYFLEVEIKQNVKIDRKLKNSPCVRLGICKHDYNPIFPIGGQDSIAYKSLDGSLASNFQIIEQNKQGINAFGNGDVIGILVNISPPHKIPNSKEINQGSSVSFFKNGELAYEYKNLKQMFYCFAVGLYNFSKVQILDGPNSKYAMPFQAKHFYQILNEPICYKDLSESKIFKI